MSRTERSKIHKTGQGRKKWDGQTQKTDIEKKIDRGVHTLSLSPRSRTIDVRKETKILWPHPKINEEHVSQHAYF